MEPLSFPQTGSIVGSIDDGTPIRGLRAQGIESGGIVVHAALQAPADQGFS